MKSIEEMQASIKNIQNELAILKDDLDDLRNEKNGGAFDFDIEEIVVKAKHDPIADHPLSKKDDYTQRRYLILLLTVAQFEQDKLFDNLLLAHRIAYGCGYLKDGDLTDEYAASHTLSVTQVDELVSLFANDDLRLLLIEEMLLMAGKFDKGLKSAAEYISQICEIFTISGNELTFLCQISEVILAENIKLYTCNIRNKYSLFDCYLNKLKIRNYREVYIPPIKKDIDNMQFYYAKLTVSDNILSVKAAYCIGNVASMLYLRAASSSLSSGKTLNYYEDVFSDSILSPFSSYNRQTKKVTDTYHVGNNFVLFTDQLRSCDFGKPVGVLYHPLDSDDNGIKEYFISHGGQINEN